MELYSDTTRFALACNQSSKIIEPIQSRCAILRFTRLTDEEVLERVLKVIQLEGIQAYDESGLEALIFTSEGDMRHALNNLQSTMAGTSTVALSVAHLSLTSLAFFLLDAIDHLLVHSFVQFCLVSTLIVCP